jgi:alkaline phosphatase
MTDKAIQILSHDSDGFFLMVEGGKIDWACHDIKLRLMLGEMLEFERAVQVVLNWAINREDTLIVVTADHETGGLEVIKNNGVLNEPEVQWNTKGHTAVKVPVYAWGEGASLFVGPMDNTDIPKRILAAITLK